MLIKSKQSETDELNRLHAQKEQGLKQKADEFQAHVQHRFSETVRRQGYIPDDQVEELFDGIKEDLPIPGDKPKNTGNTKYFSGWTPPARKKR